MRSCLLPCLSCVWWLATAVPLAAGETIHLRPGEKSVEVLAGEQAFATYLIDSGGKPVLWPIHGPTGALMTRSYPLARVAGEKTDHVHQRSLWFTHGDVNGVSFWMEEGRRGTIVHREFVRLEEGSRAVIEAVNDWLDPEGRKLLEDRRTLVFAADQDRRTIDFGIVLTPTGGPVKLGDTKEGAFGIRVPTSMDVDSRRGGRIVNSQGQTDEKAWGQPATWVDYCGPVGDETLGIAVLNHPSSFRYPTRWHVRTYGLFAANPFGLREFTGDEAVDGGLTLPVGESVALRYRVVLHRGDSAAAKIPDEFAAYAASSPAELERTAPGQ
jgi:hypothetical protein